MSKYYSKTTKGFYDTDIYRLSNDETSQDLSMPVMPSDAVLVTDSVYQSLFEAQASGSSIQSDINGNPISVAQNPPSPAQNAASALSSGINITSTSAPAINGIYSCDSTSVSNFNAIETYILRNNSFPNNASSQPWVQANGNIVSIPTIAVFNELATAIANYVAAVAVYLYSNGQSGSLPSASVMIA